MAIDTIKMSSKGQLVIPRNLRERIRAQTGTLFAVFGDEESIILKKISTPSKEALIEDLGNFAKKAKKHLKSAGITEEDIQKL